MKDMKSAAKIFGVTGKNRDELAVNLLQAMLNPTDTGEPIPKAGKKRSSKGGRKPKSASATSKRRSSAASAGESSESGSTSSSSSSSSESESESDDEEKEKEKEKEKKSKVRFA